MRLILLPRGGEVNNQQRRAVVVVVVEGAAGSVCMWLPERFYSNLTGVVVPSTAAARLCDGKYT